MKNIWIFNHYAVPLTINSQHRHNQFAKHLTKMGYNVSVFFSSQIHNSSLNLIKNNQLLYKHKGQDGINYIAIKTRSYKGSGKQRILNMVDFYLGLKKFVRKKKFFNKPDVIYASSVHPLTLIAAIKIAKKLNVPCVCEIRDLWPLTLIKLGRLNEKSVVAKLMYKMEKWIYEKADKLIFTMSGGEKYIEDQGWSKRVNLNKVYHINNGVDLKEFNENRQINRFENETFNKKSFKVTYTGSIGQANMVQKIVEAANILDKEDLYNISFEIFGEGLERESIEKYVRSNNIKNVNFYGKVNPEYIPSILSESNVNIIVGKNSDLYKYGFSQNKFFSYLASSRPIISNREVHNILRETRSGIIVAPENARAIADGIISIYNMAENDYVDYCHNANELARQYDYSNLTEKLIKVISA